MMRQLASEPAATVSMCFWRKIGAGVRHYDRAGTRITSATVDPE